MLSVPKSVYVRAIAIVTYYRKQRIFLRDSARHCRFRVANAIRHVSRPEIVNKLQAIIKLAERYNSNGYAK